MRHPTSTRILGPLAALLPLLAGCSDDVLPSPAPVAREVGGFSLHLRPGSAGVDVIASDGRALLEGIGLGSVDDNGVPLTGFAVRDVTPGFEMQFGAFRPTDTVNGPWRLAQRAELAQDGAGTVVRLIGDAGSLLAKLSITSPDDGHLAIDITPGDGPERRFSWGYACNADDHFMGFGAQTWDVDHRGHTLLTLVQEQGVGKDETNDYTGLWMIKGRRWSSHLPIPQYLARRGYVLTAETNKPAIFALCSESESVARMQLELPATVHVFDGPEPSKALERSSAKFGRPRMPPRVAFAPWNDAIYGSDNVRRVAQKLREKKVPSSVIWSEDWKGAEQIGDAYRLSEEWDVDRKLYPDIEQLAKDLHGLGFKFFVYFNTFIYEGTSAWNQTAPNGWLVKTLDGKPYTFTGAKMSNSGLLDVTNPDARAWAKEKLQEAMHLGADGWMGDFAEWLPTDSMTYAGPGLEQHNPYPMHWQEIQREAIDAENDGTDRLFFGRSGWFGTPQLADVIWAGDQRTSFQEDDGMPTVLPIGIGLGIVGVSTYGHDIAGYQSSTNPASTKELFFRWTELGAFSPVMRTHHGYQAKNNWNWESDDETTEHFATYARMHVALAPMWEGLAKVASETGVPIWRGLGLEFPQDASVWPIKDQVMIGSGMMIAPVMTDGARSRSVYLPEGSWFRWTGDAGPIEGSQTIDEPADLGQIPVFARAGAVVPLYPDGVMTLDLGSAQVPGPESVGDDREVRVFLGASGTFREAGGLAYSIEQIAEGQDTQDVLWTWNGTALPPCGSPVVAPCEEKVSQRVQRLHGIGPGTLEALQGEVVIARVRAENGAADRKLEFDVRR